jgi:hypothetical protein
MDEAQQGLGSSWGAQRSLWRSMRRSSAQRARRGGAVERDGADDGPGASDGPGTPGDALMPARGVAASFVAAEPKNRALDCTKKFSICVRAGASWGARSNSTGRVALWMARPAVRSNARWRACQARGSRSSSARISRNARAKGCMATARLLRHTTHPIHAMSVNARVLEESAIARRMGAVGIAGGSRSGRRSRVPTCSGEPGRLRGAMLMDMEGTLRVIGARPAPLVTVSRQAGRVTSVSFGGALSI